MERQALDMQLQNSEKKPLVAVYMVAYNCEKYISQAIEGVLMQETNFYYRLFIGDDCSTDSTTLICRQYQQQYPYKIELIVQPVNKGAVLNAKDVYEACFASGASYIAMCEGDDYWTDTTKLQQQVNALEADTNCAMCIHNADILYEKNCQKETYIKYPKDVYTTADLVKAGPFIPTLSIVFKTQGFHFPEWYFRIPTGDIALVLVSSINGNVRMIFKKMGVYRKHEKGVSINMEGSNLDAVVAGINLLVHFNSFTGYRFDNEINQALKANLHMAISASKSINTSDNRPLFVKLRSGQFWRRKFGELFKKQVA